MAAEQQLRHSGSHLTRIDCQQHVIDVDDSCLLTAANKSQHRQQTFAVNSPHHTPHDDKAAVAGSHSSCPLSLPQVIAVIAVIISSTFFNTEFGSVLAPHPFRPHFLPAYMNYDHLNDGITVSAMETTTTPVAVAAAAAAAAAVTATGSNGIIMQPLPKYPHEVMQAYCGNPEAICEAAARLLFMSVKWAKTVPAFVALPFADQVVLLEESWRELFVLGAAQFQIPIDAGPLLAAAGLSTEQSGADKVVSVMSEVRALQETIAKFKALHVDPTEYACLKGIVIFKTAVFANSSPEMRTLREFHSVATLQDQAQLTLSQYIRSAYPTQPFRFGKLLLLLPTLSAISGGTIEELFFRKTIGNIPIERLLVDMYKSSDF
ncbi:hypothetical protein C0Q70_10532 [Pomacea canaliculata]|uniref:NR LBD domain-containing protein n=1 Tax=Pomacea canaliculata TaxID=400727 RepID=A0A2T7P3H4_POMCA|nr:hypothetical protein C0Q70_10532 [Pomacea canaliculata]